VGSALFSLLDQVPAGVKARVGAIAIDGTSATTMLLDAESGELLAPPKLYNEAQDGAAVARAKVGHSSHLYLPFVFIRPLRPPLPLPLPSTCYACYACYAHTPLRTHIASTTTAPQLPLPLQAMAPPDHTAVASTSTLCKALAWDAQGVWQHAASEGRRPVLLHQADWLASLLHGERGASDWNNALKLGFDPGREAYPEWLMAQVGGGRDTFIC
jgi:hypothetical protein